MAAPMVRNCAAKFVGNFGVYYNSFRQLSNLNHPPGHLWSTEFWDSFYERKLKSKETSFDWFLTFESLQGHILPILNGPTSLPPIRVLDIGCGTSDFALKLYRSSSPPVHQITCIDISEVAINQMSSMHRQLKPRDTKSPGVCYNTGDIKNLDFDSDTFDMILDKGTTDAIIRSPRGTEIFGGIFKECTRLLKDDRTWVQVSDAPPEDRLDLLERSKMSSSEYKDPLLLISYKDLGVHFGVEYFMYLIYKRGKVI
ncbi:citrate synthase-lysine N-methyltransferase CSKMT, mitochondrial-like isoform X2 [Anneissia japonica]|uniref:citrate synthase-lysine N-methyltransferase CSKMT, mitochondrial-like isoform X2 n=1 Tax=Anneissia japonica TaxID=1529436 RepID=UPI0014259942|nr:citrate synthase-lysine N-methyltransferase CSKMT, mitochondrial-like isoform X2 [Anneissia japonica]